MQVYKLTNCPEFVKILTNTDKTSEKDKEQYISDISYSTKLNQKYRIIRYNKPEITKDLISTYGIFRSVIVNSLNNVVCFSPPKSLHADRFMEIYPISDDGSSKNNIIAQEFVEGTMINVFFDPTAASWQIATRSTVGGNMSFFQGVGSKTFNEMFQEACAENGLFIHTLNPMYCYSFVLQHPCNRIVVPFSKPQLYLIEVYHIQHNLDGTINVFPQPLTLVKQFGFWSATKIRFPEVYEFSTYAELINKFASPNTPYNIMGVVIKNAVSNERCKIRNPIYEEVRQLRGNQAKLQYQYLSLRKDGKIPEFLKFYPETKDELSKFRDQIHMFTNTLHQNYVSCYVKKEKPLKEFPEQYRTHMFKLHEHYLAKLREQKGFVTNTVVINYVNNLAPSLLMYCLNHNLRKRNVDTLKADLV
uniref:T4 RNA ligase 1-like N-terminal domain-containing protein n=1 Tax=viral metagenome TaxID=1070528 RepID=A0A6C0I8A3_9ZZZZ